MSRFHTFFLLTAAMFIWGFQPILVKWLLTAWTPETIIATRWIVVGVLCLGYLKWWHPSAFWPLAHDWPVLLFMGLTGMMGNSVLQFIGLKTTTVTNSTLITAITPTITAVLAFFLLKEHVTKRGWLGIVLAFCGVSAIVVQGDWSRLIQFRFNSGDLLCLASQLCWAFYTLSAKRITGHLSLVTIMGWCGLFGGMGTLLYGCAIQEFHPTSLSLPLLGCLLYLIFLGGIAANVSWNAGVKYAGTSITSVFLNLAPVVGMTSGHFLNGDPLGPVQLVGALVIFAGVYATEHQKA